MTEPLSGWLQLAPPQTNHLNDVFNDNFDDNDDNYDDNDDNYGNFHDKDNKNDGAFIGLAATSSSSNKPVK